MPNDNLTPHARRLPDNSHLSGDFHDSDWINWPPPQTRRNAPPPPMWVGRPKNERRPCPYVYEIMNWRTGHVYIGYRCRNVELNRHWSQDLLVKYFTSSKQAKDYIKQRRFEFVLINVWEFDTAREALAYEEQLLDERGAVQSPLYLNKANAGKAWNTAGKTFIMSDKQKRQISECHKGRKHSEASRRNMSEAHKGYIPTPEQRRKISAFHKGRVKSPQERINISIAQKGRTFSAETRRRMSEAAKRRIRRGTAGGAAQQSLMYD